MGLRMPPFEAIGEGDVIDLGGLKLEVYDLPGHTPGGIALLNRQDRILFVGDSIIEQTWMQLEESLSMEDIWRTLRSARSTGRRSGSCVRAEKRTTSRTAGLAACAGRIHMEKSRDGSYMTII